MVDSVKPTNTVTVGEMLPQANVRRGFPPEEFVVVPSVPIFAEHQTQAKDGRPLSFGRKELSAMVERCNRRIQETGDYATITLGHTPAPDDPNGTDPPVVGFAGPYQLGLLGEPGQQQRYAILADFYLYKEHAGVLKANPRRSPEVWLDDNYEEMFFDPIALLGAKAPRLDMGLLYAANRNGRLVEKYTAVAPAAGNVFLPSDEYQKEFDESKHPRDKGGEFTEKGGATGDSKRQTATVGETFGSATAAAKSKRRDIREGVYSSVEHLPVGKAKAKIAEARTVHQGVLEELRRVMAGKEEPKGIQEKNWRAAEARSGKVISADEWARSHAVPQEEAYLRSLEQTEKAIDWFAKRHAKHSQQGEQYMLSPEDLQQIIDAMEQLDWVQQAKAAAQAQQGSNATVPTPVPTAMPPQAPAPMPGMQPGMPPPPAAPAPPPAAAPTNGPPPNGPPNGPPDNGPPQGGQPPGLAPPAQKKEQFAMSDKDKEIEDEAGKLRNAMDEMDDGDFEEYCNTRKSRKKNYQAEGSSDAEGEEKPGNASVENAEGEGPGDSSVGDPGEKPAATKYQKERTMAEQYGEVGHKVQDLMGQVESLQKEVEVERSARVNAERYSKLADRRQHFALDLDKEVERCQYGKMTEDQFAQHLECIEGNYRRIPVGEGLPTHTEGAPLAAAASQGEWAREKYSKETSDRAMKICTAKAERGESVDYEEELEKLRNGDQK